jgi:threonine/homoserine/homoserine lactone efflux protein
MAIIGFLIASKWLLMLIGSILGAGYIFYKGYSTGSAVAKGEQKAAEEQLNHDVRSVEAENQTIESKKEQDVQAANSTSGIASLLKLWGKLQQTPGSDSKKDS